MRAYGVLTALGFALLLTLDGRADADIQLDGNVVAFASRPLNVNSCFGSAQDFVFRAWLYDVAPPRFQLIRIRYVWHDDEDAPLDDFQTAERMWHIWVERDPACDANIDDLRLVTTLSGDGVPAPLSPYFEPAPGFRAEAIPPGTPLPCYVWDVSDGR